MSEKIATEIGSWPTYASGTNSFSTDGSGIYQAVADKIDQSISQLETDIQDGVSSNFDTLAEIETYITNLKALIGDSDGALGSGETSLVTRLDAIESSLNGFVIDKTAPNSIQREYFQCDWDQWQRP